MSRQFLWAAVGLLIFILECSAQQIPFPITINPPFSNTIQTATIARTNQLIWDYYENWRSAVGFNIWGTTNIVKPISTWDLLATLPGTATQFVHIVTAPTYFYAVSAFKK